MKVLLTFTALLLPNIAMAQQLDRYVNPRFGTSMAVPSGYIVEMEGEDGDGRLYVSQDRKQSLLIWGASLVDETLEQHYQAQMEDDESLGWVITYKANGNGWRVYSGTKTDHIVYAKMIAACDGTIVQHFKFEYELARKAELDPLVNTLSNALKSRTGLDCKVP